MTLKKIQNLFKSTLTCLALIAPLFVMTACSNLPKTSQSDHRNDATSLSVSADEVTEDAENQSTRDNSPQDLALQAEPIYIEDDQQLDEATDQSSQSDDASADTSASDANDLWHRIRAGYAIDSSVKTHPQVANHERWFSNHPKYLDRTFERARPFLYDIVKRLEEEKMPLEIALLPVVESAFQPFAYSRARASGLWQFIPGTAQNYGLTIDWWRDERRDVMASTDAAIRYLQNLNLRFQGDWLLALAAYNSGEGTVERAIKSNERLNRPTDFWNLSLPQETRGYVPRLLAISNIVENPKSYNIALKHIPNEKQIVSIDAGAQIDLALAAKLAEMEIEDLYNLNASLNRWATPPQGPHALLIPADKSSRFSEKLAQLPAHERLKWKRHKVSQGESLANIARRYNTTSAVLAQANHLKNNRVRVNQHLVIPVAQQRVIDFPLTAEQRVAKTVSEPQNDKEKIVHVVRRGDSLWEVAKRHNVGVSDLTAWNGISKRSTLQTGQELVVWKSTEVKPVKNLILRKDKPTQRISYTVQKGDTLAKIADLYNITVEKIRQWNNRLLGQKYLMPGQTLTLYTSNKKAGDAG